MSRALPPRGRAPFWLPELFLFLNADAVPDVPRDVLPDHRDQGARMLAIRAVLRWERCLHELLLDPQAVNKCSAHRRKDEPPDEIADDGCPD
jgi:hypothetical protein